MNKSDSLIKPFAILLCACKKTPTFFRLKSDRLLLLQRIQVIYTSKRPKFVAAKASNLTFSFQSLVFLLTLLFACTNFSTFDRTDYDSIAFGTYCGECNGQCFQGYYLKNDNVYRIGLPDNTLENVNFDTISDKTQLDKTESEKIQAILKLLPSNIESYDKTIGSPDKQDQCEILLFLNHKSHQTKIRIDMNKRNCPAKLSKFIEAVSSLKLL